MGIDNESFVCPESTIESANQRNIAKRASSPVPKAPVNSQSESKQLVCESTIESANRRNFIKKAAVATTAVAIGGSFLGKNLIPESIARSNHACENYNSNCNFVAWDDVMVDVRNQNNGSIGLGESFLNGCSCCLSYVQPVHALTFGSVHVCGCFYDHSGEGIGSARTSGSPNKFGLDFYTCYTKRISITKAGNVGIGTCTPSSTLEVKGPTTLECTLAVSGVATLESTLTVSGTTTLGSTLYVKGNVGIGTSTPTSTLSIVGNMNATGSLCAHGIISLEGIVGNCPTGEGVFGFSPSGAGVCGTSCGCGGVGVRGTSCGPGAIPIVAIGSCGQEANLQQWRKICGTPLSVVNKCGWLGIGATCVPTTLTIGGSVSAKTVVATKKSYKMGTTDFAVLADASGPMEITLPAASTLGMMVFIKNVTGNPVSVLAKGKDTIESNAGIAINLKYDSLQLISNGSNEWLILGSSKCGIFIS